MESLHFLLSGFATAVQPYYLLFAFVGCVLGTLVGVLPGIGPVTTMAILIPTTFGRDPTASIIMLAAIFYGAMYGGTITSVLVNVPGEGASVITCLDGYQMAKKGRAGPALAIAALGSFFGGTVATMGLVLLARPLASLALRFSSPELFALMVMSLSLVAVLAGTSLVRALVSAFLGLLVAMVGIDPTQGTPRFTLGQVDLLEGVNIVVVAMGMFGVPEILLIVERSERPAVVTKLGSLWLSLKDLKTSTWPVLRGTVIGFILGLVPGMTPAIPTFVSYATEKQLSGTPQNFGTGMIEGVAGPETANNAFANAALIPLFTLGIPFSPSVAVLMGAFLMNGLVPGPFLFQERPEFVWAVIASLYIGNVILLILNLPLIPLWVAILRIPHAVLYSLILLFIVVGSYSISNSLFDVGSVVVFGLIGYLFLKLEIPPTPFILTLILGPLMERALRQSLEMSGGNFAIFVTRPMSVGFLVIGAVFIVFAFRTRVKGVGGVPMPKAEL